ncbi:fimbria/pilus outer membrane usher protein [Pseudomonas sp. EMN2]|uniref:fimbria/pilus outer membrane usher protein n=1 Tax=Pseudomonas sp. EMN2 TaxID=2615212 RepID=UPI00129BA4E4|nr:fimbria/pilus outer membrane usher protein [Pseudomonas sp. EMN2]
MRWRSAGRCVGLLALGAAEAMAEAPMSFDAELLRLRGIDPGLVDYLSQSARFTPGTHRVSLSVNDQSRGRVEVRFDAAGQLCFDRHLLDAARLLAPEEAGTDDGHCQDFLGRYGQTQIILEPESARVGLVVPTQALRPVETTQDLSAYHTGGLAGVLNYELSGLRNRFEGSNSDYWSASTELGFNAGDWIVRSHQIHTAMDGVRRSEFLDAYAQRTFAELGTVFQAGQINLVNPVLAGARVDGMQLSTEQALDGPVSRSAIEGIAQTQARVEVRQAGALIYSTVVPAGPFALADLPHLDRLTDLEVTVIEADGAQRSFTVPAALVALDIPAPGFTLGAGRVRENADVAADPWVLSAGWTQALDRSTTLSSGALMASGYQAAGLGVGVQPWLGSQIQWMIQAAKASDLDTQGLQSQLSLSQQLTEQWAVNGAYTQQTQGYRDLLDSFSVDDEAGARGRAKRQYSIGLSWVQPWVGSLSGGFSRAALHDGGESSRAYASWSRRFGEVSLSASAEWNLGGSSNLGNAAYLSLSMPLGRERRLRASLRESGGDHRLGLSMQERVSDTFSYRLGAERDSRDRLVDLSAGMSALPRYTQLDVNYAGYGRGNRSLGLGMRGGIAAHAEGITFAPYAVQDTFALVSVGELPGVKLTTPAGPVWTDDDGQALVAQLAPYGSSTVEVQPRSLPRNVDLVNGVELVQAGRGAVAKVDFQVNSTRRALLQASDDAGQPLPGGAMVTDEQGQFVTLVQEGGLVFVHNLQDQRRLWVKPADRPACELHYSLPDASDLDAYFESTTASCRTL